jgi:hypothetical protein
MIEIFHNLALFWVKKRQFFAEFFGKNIFKIITSVPGVHVLRKKKNFASTELAVSSLMLAAYKYQLLDPDLRDLQRTDYPEYAHVYMYTCIYMA